MSWIAAGTATVAVGTSIYKHQKAKSKEKKERARLAAIKRPEYKIPQEIKDNLTQAEVQSLEGLPAAQKKEYIQNIERSQVAQQEASADRQGGLIGMQNAIRTSNDAYNSLVSRDAAEREGNRSRVYGARADLANAKLAKLANEERAYQQELAGVQGNLGASIQQQNAAFDTGTAAAIYGAGSVGSRGARNKKRRREGDYDDGFNADAPTLGDRWNDGNNTSTT